jgi:hypothetical protein
MRGLALSGAALLAIVGTTGCVDIVGADFNNKVIEREDRHFAVAGKPDVNLSTFDGAIEIRTWSKPDVDVTIEKHGQSKEAIADIDVKAEQSGDRIIIEIKSRRTATGWNFGWSRGAKLIVSMPATGDVHAHSGDGSIDVERLGGHIELTSGDGSIRGRDLSGAVNVSTGDGSITMDGKFAALRARSGDGSVRVRVAPGSVASSDWNITTGDGSVTLELPDGFGAELDAHTGDGRIHLNDLTLTNVTGRIRRNDARGRLGAGGPAVRVRTGDGSITLRRQ